MTDKLIKTFEYDSIWNKSKVFIDRAISARDNQDQMGFHLWAALSIELLGKAVLANIHPSLIADPNCFDNLLAACNRPHKTNVKSITAKTVFERVQYISKKFDKKMQDDCIRLMNRRNTELHSGESPLIGLKDEAWVPNLWKIIDVLLVEQNKTLEEWLPIDEAGRIRKVLSDSEKLLIETVRARIARRKLEFDARLPIGTRAREDYIAISKQITAPQQLFNFCDESEQHECPSCGCSGWLLGYDAGEEIVDSQHDETGWIEFVTKFFSVGEFQCTHCGLKLEGVDELTIANLPEYFERMEEREPDYMEEYGNE